MDHEKSAEQAACEWALDERADFGGDADHVEQFVANQVEHLLVGVAEHNLGQEKLADVVDVGEHPNQCDKLTDVVVKPNQDVQEPPLEPEGGV